MIPPPPTSTLFPYTTLFRSEGVEDARLLVDHLAQPVVRDGDEGVALLLEHLGEVRHPHHRSEEYTSELQSLTNLVCRLLLEKKKKHNKHRQMTHCIAIISQS